LLKQTLNKSRSASLPHPPAIKEILQQQKINRAIFSWQSSVHSIGRSSK
jgi:hypothetical protein